MDMRIRSVFGREILDSRGNPTVEVEVELMCGVRGLSAVPSGASTGKFEAVELRDGGSRFHGKGVLKAIENIRDIIAPKIIGENAFQQEKIDALMIGLDGTQEKRRLGANAILGVSMAVCRAAAKALNIPLYHYIGGLNAKILPVPMMNILNGGVHANWQGADFQEYMISPFGAESFREAVRWGSEVYHTLKSLLKSKGYSTAVGDEGGFAPKVSSNEEPLELILKAIEEAGYDAKKEIGLAMDPAASSFYDGEYILRCEGTKLTSEEMVGKYKSLVESYPILLIEDGLAEEDWSGWKILNDELGNKVTLVGDDIFVTNVDRIKRGIKENVANAVLIKPNQIGTVTETIEAVKIAQKAGWGVMVSHRSGETVDTFIADFTVAMGTGLLKAGAPCRGERVEKYNRLMRIEEELGDFAVFAGRRAFIR